jgi:hypothetical protein
VILNCLGFESGLSEFVVDSNLGLSTSVFRSGSRSMQMYYSPSYGEIGYDSATSFTGKYCVLRFYFRVDIAPSINRCEVMRFQSSNPIFLTLNSSRQLELFENTTSLGTYSTPLATNTWYRIEIGLFPTKCIVKLNGTQIITSSINDRFLTKIYLGAYASQGSNPNIMFYYDDVCLTDNMFPGEGQVINLAGPSNVTFFSEYQTNVATATGNIRYAKPWAITNGFAPIIESGGNGKLYPYTSGYSRVRGPVLTADNFEKWTNQPVLRVASQEFQSCFILSCGIMVEYGQSLDPEIQYIGLESQNARQVDSNLYANFKSPTLINFDYTSDFTLTVAQVTLQKSGTQLTLSLVNSPVTTVTVSSSGNIKLALLNYFGLKYKLLYNDIQQITGTDPNSFSPTSITLTGSHSNFIVTSDFFHFNVETVLLSPVADGTSTNYTGVITSIDEYPFNSADYITLTGLSTFTTTQLMGKIYCVREIYAAESNKQITIFNQTFTTNGLEHGVTQQWNEGQQWTTIPEINVSGSLQLYGSSLIVLREKQSSTYGSFLAFL